MSTGTTDGRSDAGVPAPEAAAAPVARRRGVLAWGVGRTVAFITVTCLAGATLLGGMAFGTLAVVESRLGPGGLAGLLTGGTPGVAADGTVDGVRTYEVLTNLHQDTPVGYAQYPPVGGDHLSVWQDCGFYDAPVITEAAVHSLEHGAVWVTYDPDLPGDEVDELRRLAGANPYLLVSPLPDLPAPVVASGWGVQLRLDDAGDPRLPAFLVGFQQGPQTPEPGAPCSGGLTGTASQESQV